MAKLTENIPITFTFKVRNSAGALFTPTSISRCDVVAPGGSSTAVVPTNTGTGLYSGSFTPTESGNFLVNVEGTTGGAVVARGRGAFYVSPDNY